MSFDILSRWTGAVIYHSADASDISTAALAAIAARANLRNANLTEADLTRADLTRANVTWADLTRANLKDANLTRADLTWADLKGADLTRANQLILRIQGTRHEINAIDGDVRVGCTQHDITWWVEHFKDVGNENSYTPDQIAEYGMHLAHIAAVLALRMQANRLEGCAR